MVKKVILIAVVVILIGIQFIHPERNLGVAEGPQDVTHYLQVPDSVKHILKASCYDCHSNHTRYPWYANIQPVGWWLTSHVNDGKRHLNFSDFSRYTTTQIDRKLKGTAREVQAHEMPLPSYTLIHTDAILSDAQVQMLVSWANSQREAIKK